MAVITFSTANNEVLDEPIIEKEVPIIDSIEIAGGKISATAFYVHYGADNWFKEFKANKVAFDRKYDGQIIDVDGVVSRISTIWGCSQVEFAAEDSPSNAVISFANCPENNDKWADEVAKIVVGDAIHIRSIYSGNISNDYRMELGSCHIINDKPTYRQPDY